MAGPRRLILNRELSRQFEYDRVEAGPVGVVPCAGRARGRCGMNSVARAYSSSAYRG